MRVLDDMAERVASLDAVLLRVADEQQASVLFLGNRGEPAAT